MNREDIRSNVITSLKAIAPEAEPAALAPNADIRDALDIDSMDFLRFVVSLHERLQVDIPERDYAKVRTLDACVSYLEAKLAAR